jgi:serine/threonine protein kinase/tetratricopeptide (TPR) repeat protein
LRGQVARLLAAHRQADSFLEQPARPLGGTVASPPAAGPASEPWAEPGSREQSGGVLAGRYKLLEAIGEGGMGTVWMSQQTEPVKRLVAIKLIKPGMDSRQVLARFEAERQALALMDHPNIARVLDAGAAPDGRPFFVMELVKGVPITRYCDEHRLTPRQRLELFVPVCQAILHAHHKGVIHRDVKPSNVLVALYDDRPVPKVIDFGVAKATGPQLTEQTLHTGFGAVVGTLEYMSPEQASFNQLDVDTRSDIYSLGVLLYELLAGSPPFSRKELEKAGVLEMLRVIREQAPTKPSTKLSTAEGLPTLAANRGTEPAKLTKLVRGELDWIVMKALEKDRSRRYETANGLAHDIERYLADEPVQACPPSAWYRFRKFARRNKAALAVATTLAGGVLLAVGGLALGALWTWQEKERKEAALLKAVQRTEFARQAADDMYTDVAVNWLADEPYLQPVQKKFLLKAANFYRELAQEERQDPTARLKAGSAHRLLGLIENRLGHEKEAEAALRQAVTLLTQLDSDLPNQPGCQQALAYSLDDLARFLAERRPLSLPGSEPSPEAEELLRRALALRQMLVGRFPDKVGYRGDLAASYDNLGVTLRESRRLGEAQQALREALEIRQKLLEGHAGEPEYQSNLAATLNNLALLRMDQQQWREARQLLESAAAHQKQALRANPRHFVYRWSLCKQSMNLARTFQGPSEAAQAEKAWREAIALSQKLADDFPDVPAYRTNWATTNEQLAHTLVRSGRLPEATDLLRQVVAQVERLAKDFPAAAEYRYEQARLLNSLFAYLWPQGLLPEAEAAMRHSVQLLEQLGATGRDEPAFRLARASSLHNWGTCLAMLGKNVDAERSFRQAIGLFKDLIASPPEDADRPVEYTAVTMAPGAEFRDASLKTKLAASYAALMRVVSGNGRRPAEAEKPYREALESGLDDPELPNSLAWMLAASPERGARDPRRAVELAQEAVAAAPGNADYWNTLGVARYRSGNGPAAITALRKSIELSNGGHPADWFFLAMAHWQRGEKEQAREWYDRAAQWMQTNQQALEKNKRILEELQGFRAEAEGLLKSKSDP